MGITDYEGNPRESSNFFGSALSVTAGNHDARGGIGCVDFADGVAGLSVSGGGDGAGVQNDDVSFGGIGGKDAALLEQLLLDGGAVRLGGAASELLDKECTHGIEAPESYLSIEPHGKTARAGGSDLRRKNDGRNRRKSPAALPSSGQAEGGRYKCWLGHLKVAATPGRGGAER